MKYQCNSCGVVYEYRSDAVNCHPDINEIPDEELESRLAAQQSVHPTMLCAGHEKGSIVKDCVCQTCGLYSPA